ncbi:site-specific DNA-methyltransferase [Aeromonas allosaccharophila]
MNKQKLELTWIGKDKRPRLEPRILLEDKNLSYQDPSITTNSESDVSRTFNDNLLIHGDNLLALKALEQQYAGEVKCIFIDPPYNTGSAFTHYDDGLEHSMWLTMMRDRLELLRALMSEDGSIWIAIDDNEAHYLKVLCDEIFGRKNFVANVVWQNRYSRSNDASISLSHNHIFVYTKSPETWKKIRNRLPRTEEQAKQYKNPDNDPRGPWRAIPWDAPNLRPNLSYPIVTPTGKTRLPPEGRCWSRTEGQWLDIVSSGLAYFGKSGDGAPSFKQFLLDAAPIVPNTWWSHDESGHTDEAKKEMHSLFGRELAFDTPKPERLINRIIHIATNDGDLVLDSFAGSGTTGAVAHKMGRRWIMVELGEHCHTHIVPRLKKVIDGEDQGGISKAVNWQGGGGFRYLRLAPSLLKKDDWGNWVINKEYNAEMLTEAVCKHMGFTYAPSQTQFWNHGYSTETDHIYVTTGSLAYDQLKRISEEVGSERTLLICCKAFMMDGADFPNLTLKKIPKVILNKCEWDHDDYSFTLNVLPEEQDEEWADDDSEE